MSIELLYHFEDCLSFFFFFFGLVSDGFGERGMACATVNRRWLAEDISVSMDPSRTQTHPHELDDLEWVSILFSCSFSFLI